jgi:hypothetical protein
VCQACDGGTISTAGNSTCSDCIAGMYSAGGDALCSACPAGSFSSSAGSASCADCPGNEYSLAMASDCTLCLKDYYVSVDKDCTSCPDGAKCRHDGGSTQELLELQVGYWRFSLHSVDVRECPYPLACIGSNTSLLQESRRLENENFGNVYCQTGYTGPLCAVILFSAFSLATWPLRL